MVGCFSIAQRQKRSNKSSFVWAAKSTVGHIIVAFLTSRYIRGNPHGAFCFMGRGNNAAYVEAFDDANKFTAVAHEYFSTNTDPSSDPDSCPAYIKNISNIAKHAYKDAGIFAAYTAAHAP